MYTITIQEDDFDLAQEMAKAEAAASSAGAVVCFTGRVRGHDYDKPLSHLFLE